MRWIGRTILGLFVAGCITGCITGQSNPAATQPVTVQDLATTQPSYWLAQPAFSTASSVDFSRLWSASEQAARDHLFDLDRQDYRSGVLTTKPLVSAQFFEPWRPDVYTLHDLEESSTATIRRTIEFQFVRNSDWSYTVTPRVIVERRAIAEKRITSVTGYRGLFDPAAKLSAAPRGTSELDEGYVLRPRYWYVIGRDEKFERVLADSIAEKVQPH